MDRNNTRLALKSPPKRLVIGFSVSLSVLLPFLLYSWFLGRSDPQIVDSFCATRSCQCTDWYRGNAGSYTVENNVWNKGENQQYQQCVILQDADQGVSAGWVWNWPGIRFNVVAYPNLMYGKNPWLPSTTPNLPLRIGDLGCLEVDFEVEQVGSGKGNLAFDLWITREAASQPTDISGEVMIWLSRQGFKPAGIRADQVDLGADQVDFYKKENHQATEGYTWTFYAFVYPEDFTHGRLDLMEVLDYLVANGYVSTDDFLSGIQLGNEVVSGYGQTLVRQCEVRFCE